MSNGTGSRLRTHLGLLDSVPVADADTMAAAATCAGQRRRRQRRAVVGAVTLGLVVAVGLALWSGRDRSSQTGDLRRSRCDHDARASDHLGAVGGYVGADLT